MQLNRPENCSSHTNRQRKQTQAHKQLSPTLTDRDTHTDARLNIETDIYTHRNTHRKPTYTHNARSHIETHTHTHTETERDRGVAQTHA